MLNDLLVADMDKTSEDEVDYDDVDQMKYYYDRAKVLFKVKELIRS